MTELALYSLCMLLFILIFMFIRSLLFYLFFRSRSRVRLYAGKERFSQPGAAVSIPVLSRINQHLHDLLCSSGSKWSVGATAVLSFVMLFSGLLLGTFYFESLRGVLTLSVIFGALPYLRLRIRLISVHMKSRMELLPAAEIFYQAYMLVPHKNISSVLEAALQGERMQASMRTIFAHLYHHLMIGRDKQEGLRIFSLSLGNVWGDHLASMLHMAIAEGMDISENLQELIEDMRRAQRANQLERNRLLEIRIANFTPILFLVLFLGINFKLNYSQSYYNYVLDPDGRNMLLNALLLIFASFLMGIFLSMKKM